MCEVDSASPLSVASPGLRFNVGENPLPAASLANVTCRGSKETRLQQLILWRVREQKDGGSLFAARATEYGKLRSV